MPPSLPCLCGSLANLKAVECVVRGKAMKQFLKAMVVMGTLFVLALIVHIVSYVPLSFEATAGIRPTPMIATAPPDRR